MQFRVYTFLDDGNGYRNPAFPGSGVCGVVVTAGSYSRARAEAARVLYRPRIPTKVVPAIHMVDYNLVRYQAGLLADDSIYANLYRHEWCVSCWQ